jgi:hypothetical protein
MIPITCRNGLAKGLPEWLQRLGVSAAFRGFHVRTSRGKVMLLQTFGI